MPDHNRKHFVGDVFVLRQERKRVRQLVKTFGARCNVSMEEKAAVRKTVRAAPHASAPGPEEPVQQFNHP